MGPAVRLLKTGASDGPTNMGVDEALATLCRDHPILRFYGWEAPVLSIGYFQRTGEIDLEASRHSGVSIVRRPTGGRAVLHHQDLTYSLILPLGHPWTGFSITESYRHVNACLQRGLETLGVPATIASVCGENASSPSPFCFSTVARHEVLVGGRKVIGSAQRRFPAALLQQGTILLDFEPDRLLGLLRHRERAHMAASLGLVGSLREALGSLPDGGTVVAAIEEGFARVMEVELREGTLEPNERRLADQLRVYRYASDDWTFRR